MKKALSLLSSSFLLFSLLLAMGSCEEKECLECTDGQLAPYIRVKFINQDSLTKVDALYTTTNSSITTTNNLRTAYNQEIAEGDDSFIAKRDSVEDVLVVLRSNLAYFDEIRKRIRRGAIKLGPVYPGSKSNPPYQFTNELTGDSLDVFPFTLDVTTDSSVFYISIQDTSYMLQLSYQRKEIVDINKLLIKAINPVIDTTTFESSTLDCKFNRPECLSNETDIVVYF
ncbi:hypothetical protein QWY31_06985 [Cytophagales bacterium LB-30]|uniref:Lipoprotein n=1 Tax=Shiella aurantiaca TaxID=3058365 RepID=A0ABT8F445_9BACT|nr:hypothetical protein [Shiella aurantiaca]MDN4165238.1 hypothetical protein [Shiella aurantiaca]